MTTKLEINIRTLISHCEQIANDNDKDWRLKKYIKSLDTMINEMEGDLDEDTNEQKKVHLREYGRRCQSLKERSNYVESSSEKITKSRTKELSTGDQLAKEIDQIQSAKYHNDLRKELIGKDELESGLRVRRNMTSTVGATDDMNQTVKYYSNLQEKLAEDMLSLTRSLKEQTETANKIIKKDTEIVKKSTSLSDKNVTSLHKEADKLQDHSKKAWKCWMWLMIGLVMLIFIFMVLFMKIVKKKKA